LGLQLKNGFFLSKPVQKFIFQGQQMSRGTLVSPLPSLVLFGDSVATPLPKIVTYYLNGNIQQKKRFMLKA